MKYSTYSYLVPLVLITLSAASFNSIAETKRASESPHFGEKGWDFDLGLNILVASDFLYKNEEQGSYIGISPIINTSYYGDNLYFHLDDKEGLLLGYSLVKDNSSAIDIIAAPRFGGFAEDNEVLEDLGERQVDLHLGVRYTLYQPESVYTFEISQDVSGNHEGHILSAAYEKEWQVKNTVVTGSIGGAYISDEMSDYYFGVSAAEANADFAAFKAKGSVFATVGLRAEHAINENWVVKGGIFHTFSDGHISDSPITADNSNLSAANASIVYHF